MTMLTYADLSHIMKRVFLDISLNFNCCLPQGFSKSTANFRHSKAAIMTVRKLC